MLRENRLPVAKRRGRRVEAKVADDVNAVLKNDEAVSRSITPFKTFTAVTGTSRQQRDKKRLCFVD